MNLPPHIIDFVEKQEKEKEEKQRQFVYLELPQLNKEEIEKQQNEDNSIIYIKL